MTPQLDSGLAQTLAKRALEHLTREWPYSRSIILAGPEAVVAPKADHPIFHGSFDWHSCVHSWWQVLRLRRLFPAIASAPAIDALADRMFTAEAAAGEAAYFAQPLNATFERPYGRAWLLALHAEMARRHDKGWAKILEPLARLIADQARDYLPRLNWPVRHGVHPNTAFAMILMHDWAQGHDPALALLIKARGLFWFGDDRDVRPLEPSGEDFLSPTLCTAVLMRRLLPAPAFADWISAYMPDPAHPLIAALRRPLAVSDRNDGRLVHLDGLNLSRAWCWRELAEGLGDPGLARDADALIEATLPHLADSYMGDHWLGSFALLALAALRDPD